MNVHNNISLHNPYYFTGDPTSSGPLRPQEQPVVSSVFLSPNAEGYYQSGAISGSVGANRRLEANQMEEDFMNGISEFRIFLQNRKYDEQTLEVLSDRSKLTAITDPAEKEKVEKAIAEVDGYIRGYLGKQMLNEDGALDPVKAEYAIKVASTMSNSEIRRRMSQLYLSNKLQVDKIKNINDYWERVLKGIQETDKLARSSGNSGS